MNERRGLTAFYSNSYGPVRVCGERDEKFYKASDIEAWLETNARTEQRLGNYERATILFKLLFELKDLTP